jgi:hypothetical protein
MKMVYQNKWTELQLTSFVFRGEFQSYDHVVTFKRLCAPIVRKLFFAV